MGSLKGKRAFITGGGQGIGYSIVEELMRQGADVAIHYFSSKDGAEKLTAASKSFGVRAKGFQADLTKESEAKRLVGEVAAFLNGIDILVNNTGDLVGRKTIADIDAAYIAKIMDINVNSMVYVTREASPHLIKANGASIINLASLAGRKGGHPGSLIYSTAKGAVLTFTRALSNELAPKGVRVNAVAPGLILGTHFHNTHTTKESADATIAGIPVGRAGTPEDVARTVAFLASEYDGFITGATIDINGGVYSA
ncbi:MAG: SDR family oxidoreductase [Spirochaetes bacterium]|nr:SDR family oxidoreductase [Spirochaetota bacterium]